MAAKRKIAKNGPKAASRTVALAIIGAVLLALTAVAVQTIGDLRADARVAHEAKFAATSLAARLGNEVEGLRRLLRAAMASADPRSEAGLAAMKGLIETASGLAVRLRLVAANTAETDAKGDPPVSFATLTLLREAERGADLLPAEVHLVNAPGAYVAVALPLRQGGAVRGILVGAFPASLVQDTLDAMGRIEGRAEIVQVAGGNAVALATSSGASTVFGRADATAAVPGTIWEVRYWPASGLILGWSLAILLAVAGAAALLGIGWLWSKRFTRDLAADHGVVQRLVESVAAYRSVGSLPGAKVGDNAALFSAIVQSAVMRGAAAPEAAAEAAPPMDEAAANAPAKVPGPGAAGEGSPPPESIFRAYDIRGIYGETLNEDHAYGIGRAIGSLVFENGEQQVAVGRDVRRSSGPLAEALIRGLLASGRDVIDIGIVPTPVLYFAGFQLGSGSGVMVTGSHNPPEYNGFKLTIGGECLSPEQIVGLRDRILSGNLLQGHGSYRQQDMLEAYQQRLLGDVHLIRPLKVVVDGGNGAAGELAAEVLRQLGCEVYALYCDPDGSFPNHHPDPSEPANLQALMLQVQAVEADLGIALDGDGDRIGVIDGRARIIWPDRLLMLLANDVLLRNPGADIVYDVKSTRHLAPYVLSNGGRPIMWKSGHSLMKAKMRETGALLGGEFSGHLFFKERWYGFDDAVYAAARLLEVLASDSRPPFELFDELPNSLSTPELRVGLPEGASFLLMRRLKELAHFPEARVSNLDGLRVEFEDSWGLVRPSNTTPALVFRFEGDSDSALERVKDRFRALLGEAAPHVTPPF
ncbi:MAG: phosphomannomutase/phosphoglucomutase [Gammaproteobacteria bacterium]|nr:phosphomannomutase/phosphoglucomutase [Gammaproteobacteria bacterium]